MEAEMIFCELKLSLKSSIFFAFQIVNPELTSHLFNYPSTGEYSLHYVSM